VSDLLLTDKTLEGQFADEELGRLLVATDLAGEEISRGEGGRGSSPHINTTVALLTQLVAYCALTVVRYGRRRNISTVFGHVNRQSDEGGQEMCSTTVRQVP
jgi:hypothetical protein